MSNEPALNADDPRLSRRDLLRLAAAVGVGIGIGVEGAAADDDGKASDSSIQAIVPRGNVGHQFVLYSDCCSGVPNTQVAKNLRQVNRIVARIRPRPEFLAFPGDAISGYTTNYDELRRQWDYWQKTEMKWVSDAGLSLYQSTSNHNTYDYGSEKVFREKHPDIPKNGFDDQVGLAYFIRRDDFLYISTHQPDRLRDKDYRPGMPIDTKWLDRVLSEHKKARFKIVAGHYPVHPVNGYVENPLWCLQPEERQAFWGVLVKHRVQAYLGSHVIAFDVQVRDGVLQIVSGGAGTNHGPDGFMPGLTEYLHAVQMALDPDGIRYQVIDMQGKRREWLQWPLSLPSVDAWRTMNSKNAAAQLAPRNVADQIVGWRFQGQHAGGADADQSLLCGFDQSADAARVWIGLEAKTSRLIVRLIPESKYGLQTWTGPRIDKDGGKFDFQLAVHPGMGPGGILWRSGGDPGKTARWSSLSSTSAMGTERLTWPQTWVIGRGHRSEDDRAFQGKKLLISWTHGDVRSF